MTGWTRRGLLGVAAASAAALAMPALAQGAPKIVVVGGGFGGAACARALRKANAAFDVTLIEPNKTFVACPFSNEVIAGLRPIEQQEFGYDKIAADGVRVVPQMVDRIDTQARNVTLGDGTALPYDRLVLAPGIDFHFEALDGYSEAASARMPHAWKAGEQTLLLRRQLEAMEDGGTVIIAIAANPLRCPPAPYERASLIAHYLKAKKPRSKILILDSKDGFSQQRLFEHAWQKLYPGMIERIALSQGGRVTSVDASTNSVVTDFGNYTGQVVNVIPPQKAGHVTELAGTADKTGWCPIDPVSFQSKLVPDVHVVGDSCIAGAIPKSASAASEQGKACAAAITRLLADQAPQPAKLAGACYNTVAPDYSFSLVGLYEPKDGLFVEADGGARSSRVDAPQEVLAREAADAAAWYQKLTTETFG